MPENINRTRMKKNLLLAYAFMILASCTGENAGKRILPDVPDGAEAVSLHGEPLFAPVPPAAYRERFAGAKSDWEANPGNPELLIWYGRWAAYCGEYRESIRIFTEGIEAFPEDARMYRHRGHRYITIRELDRAVADFEKAVRLTAGKPDEVEPDGMPNPLNIPVSTLQSNIFYHLGLARYLQGDLEGALEAWDRDQALAVNDDMLVATMHWIYMALRELGLEQQANERLAVISEDMQVIENDAYYQLCMFYKGELALNELLGEGEYGSSTMNDAMLFGLGNWFLYNGDRETAMEFFSRIFDGGTWASFGYIAAESKMAKP
jgi:tetratricopeptide (TPR) repeat protein